MGDDNPSPTPLSVPCDDFESFCEEVRAGALGKRKATGESNELKVVKISTAAEIASQGGSVSSQVGTAGSARSPNTYPSDFSGDFLVLVDTSKSEAEGKRIRNSIFLYRKIKNLGIGDIALIKDIGRTLFRVKFHTAKGANKFAALNPDEVGFRPFIPESFVYSYGVIRNIPLELDDDYIRLNILSDVPVVSARRFLKRTSCADQDGAHVETPTYSVKIGFYSNEVPESIVLDYCHVRVDLYYPPVRQCRNCGQLGHTLKGCRSRKKCLNCGRSECSGACSTKCILCGDTSHSGSNSKVCPKWRQENEIKKIMTLRKISRREVLASYSANRFEAFNDYDGNFPDMVQNRPAPVRDRNAEVGRILTPRKYSSVVLRKPPLPRPRPNFTRAQPINTDPITPVIGRGNERVSDLEKILSQFMSLMRNYFAKEGNGPYLRVLEDFDRKFASFVSDFHPASNSASDTGPVGPPDRV